MKPGTKVIIEFNARETEGEIALDSGKCFYLKSPYSGYPIDKKTLEHKNKYEQLNFKIREK